MDVIAAFVASTKSAELMKPTDGPFHHPTINTQPTTMFGVTPSQDWLNTSFPQRIAMGFGVVSSIPLQPTWTPARAATLTTYGWDRLDQRKKLRHVVSVGTRHRGGQRSTLR